jgi:CheY-like chemotaxis protein/tRNA A-37 threonylcarbamoyl transferase component Bud32
VGTQTILIVEDEAIIARELEVRLRGLGYHVHGIASSGREALDLLGREQVHLVLMDIVLAGDMDGIDTAGEIRKRWSVPIIYLTAYTDEATLLRAKLTKPYGYIAKPYTEPELRANIEMALHKHQAEAMFMAALEKDDPAERAASLDEACAGDPALREWAERLLTALKQAGTVQLYLGQTVLGEGSAQPPSGIARPAAAEGAKGEAAPRPAARCGVPKYLLRIDNYSITNLVGRGTGGVVFRGFDEVLHRIVAVKVMAPQLATDAVARRRFLREARAMASIRDDHVIDVYAVGEKQGLPYLVMEFVAGVSLQAKLRAGLPLELEDILRIGYQTASGLAAAHAGGVIHRDITPSNILLENHIERVKITDFGLAFATDDAKLTQVGAICGTPKFMAPEQANGETPDQRSDLFSLGSVLYTMCTGQVPFAGGNSLAVLKQVCEAAPRPIGELNPKIPDWMIQIVNKLHAKDPLDRIQSANKLAKMLRQRLLQVSAEHRKSERG